MDSDAEDSMEDQEVDPVIRAGAAHRSDDIMLWVHFGEIIAEGFTVDAARDPDDKHPTVVLKRMTAQQLFDDLWAMGFRPEVQIQIKPVITCDIDMSSLTRIQALNATMQAAIDSVRPDCKIDSAMVPPETLD